MQDEGQLNLDSTVLDMFAVGPKSGVWDPFFYVRWKSGLKGAIHTTRGVLSPCFLVEEPGEFGGSILEV